MKIDIKSIPEEGIKIEAKEPLEIPDAKKQGIELKQPVSVSIQASCTANILLISGEVKTEVGLVCSKCLKGYKKLLGNNNFNLNCDVTGKTEVDITEDIRDEIIVSLPIKSLCKSNCKGLCPSCGKDLNLGKCSCKLDKGDVKWKGLNKLKLK